MSRSRFVGRLFVVAAVSAAVVVGAGAASATVQRTVIDVVSVNDFHGRIEADGASAGAAVIGGAVKKMRDANPNTLLVSAGDNIGASTFTSFIQKDEPTLDALNNMGLVASATGNHEFDRGFSDLTERVQPLARFPYISSNIYDTTTGQPALPQYTIQERGGVSIAFVGATTEELPSLVSPAGMDGIEVRDIPSEVNRVASALRDGDLANGEADAVVLLVHEGAASPDHADATGNSPFGRIANEVGSDVDAIVSAHTHQKYNHRLNGGRPAIQAAKYGENIGHLRFTFDSQSKKLTSMDSEVLSLTKAGQPLYSADPVIGNIVSEATEYADEFGSKPVGRISGSITRAHTASGSENRGGSSTLANLVADTHLWATRDLGTEIAFMNPGGVRSDLLSDSAGAGAGAGAGDAAVSYKSVAAIQPYANTLISMTLTGAQLRAILEQQWQPSTASRAFLKLGVSRGFSYVADPAAASGSRITHMFLNGEPIADEDTHKVVVNAFLASGGDNFVTLGQGAGRADSGRSDLQAMIDYFAEHETVSADTARRSIGFSLGGPSSSAGSDAPGEWVVELSSLLYSESVQDARTVTLGVGSVELASAPIDPTIDDDSDNTGRATLRFLVPADLVGDQSLHVSVPETGTRFEVPVRLL